MGTTCTYKPKGQNLTEFFINHGVLRWSEPCAHVYTVLDSALVNLSEYYAAIEQVDKATGDRRVWAAMFKVKMFKEGRDGYNFCYKDMDESMGPCYYNCPERILKLLTPTEYEHARAWRAKCWERIEKANARPKVVPGIKLRLNGVVYTVLKSLAASGFQVVDEYGDRYRMKRTQARSAEIVAS